MSKAHGVPSTVSISSSGAASSSVEQSDALVEPRRSPWLETLGLSLLAPLGAAGLAPDDPMLLGAAFPWLALVPLLVGAQHGALAAAVSTALLGGIGLLHGELGVGVNAEQLAAFVGGCLATGLIAGGFRDRAAARLTQLGSAASEGARRVARLGREQALLELSHRKLEERLLARSWSLASAFEDARRAIAGSSSLATLGDVVLNVLANHALVQSASLASATESDGGRVLLEPRTSLNGPARPNLQHPLVRRAIETGRVVAVDTESALETTDASVLAAAPLCTVDGRLLGVVLIHDMPFMAFQAENLKNLATLTAMLADVLEDRFVEPVLREQLGLGARGEAEVLALDSFEERADERAAPERELMPESAETRKDGFVGTRTGTHRRGRLAQSA